MGERPSHNRIASGNPWSAGCSETGTSGAEGGPGNQTGRDPGTAPRSDPYTKLAGPAKWTWFYLYTILDIYSRYAVGWMVAHREAAALAERLLADTIRRQGVTGGQLTVHADRGTSMTSKPVAMLLADLGVTKSHSARTSATTTPTARASSTLSSTTRPSPIGSAASRTLERSARPSSAGTTSSIVIAASGC